MQTTTATGAAATTTTTREKNETKNTQDYLGQHRYRLHHNDNSSHFWLRKTSGVGVPKRTTSQSAKSDSKASVTLFHCAGPMKVRSCQAALVAWALFNVMKNTRTKTTRGGGGMGASL